MASEDPSHQPGGEFAVVGPVVPGLAGRQGHVHPGGVADIFILGPGAALARMGDAPAGAGDFFGFIKARQQQGQKDHVIAEAQAAELAVGIANGPADAAVHCLIAVFLFLAELLQRGNDKSKHGMHLQ